MVDRREFIGALTALAVAVKTGALSAGQLSHPRARPTKPGLYVQKDGGRWINCGHLRDVVALVDYGYERRDLLSGGSRYYRVRPPEVEFKADVLTDKSTLDSFLRIFSGGEPSRFLLISPYDGSIRLEFSALIASTTHIGNFVQEKTGEFRKVGAFVTDTKYRFVLSGVNLHLLVIGDIEETTA